MDLPHLLTTCGHEEVFAPEIHLLPDLEKPV